MKALILILTLSFLSLFVNADEPSKVEVAVLKYDKEIKLFMEKPSQDVVKIKINNNNRNIHIKKIKDESTVKITYNIDNLPDGEYVIQVTKNKEVVYTKKINLKNEKID